MTITLGDTVRFARPDDEETALRFVVIDDRDDRVLVASLDFPDWRIAPTFVYAKADLELAPRPRPRPLDQ